MATKEIVVNLRLTDGDAVSKARAVKGALIDLKDEILVNNKALRENAKAIKAVDAAQKAGEVTTEQAAVSVRLLTNERERLKRTSSDLEIAQEGLRVQFRELKNDVGGATEAGLRFRDKMAEASLEALKQSGILGQLETRTQALKDEQEKANQEFKEGVITQQQYDDVLKRTSTELVTVEQKEKMLREEVDRLNREFKEGVIGVDQYKQELGRLGQAQQQATGSFSQFFGGINDGKSALTGLVSNYIGIGAAVYGAARAIGSAITTIKDFQQENANLASILGKTRAEIKALTDSAIEIGPALGRAPEEVTKLQTELAKLGFTEPQILAAQQAVIQLANATGESLPKSAEVAAATLKGFDLQAEDTQRVVDVMAQSFNATSLDLEKFSVAMATLAPAAKAAGFNIEETTALVGVLADRGLDASVVGTSLRSMFIDLSKSGMSLDDALETINNSTNKTKTAFELFGERAAGAAVILAENRQETDALAVSLGNAGGAAQKMADEQLNTLTGATNELSASWQAFVLKLQNGEGVIGQAFKFAVDAAGGLLNVLDKISRFSSANIGSTVAEEMKGANIELAASVGNVKELTALTKKYREEAENADNPIDRTIAQTKQIAAVNLLAKAIREQGDATTETAKVEATAVTGLDDQADALAKTTVATRELTAAEKERAAAAAEAARLMADAGIGPAPTTAQGTGTASVAAQAPADDLGSSLAVGADPATILAASQDINDQLLALQIEFEEKKTITFADYLIRRQELETELAGAEVTALKNQAELDGFVTLNEALAIVDAEFKAGIIKSDEDHAAKRAAVSKVYYSEVAKGAANLFSALSSLAQEGSAEQKALATTAALINTYQGATAALAAPDVLPQPFALVVKLLSVAAVVASGLASVKKIQGFERGGFTDAARSNKKAVGVVHANEWVAPAHMVNDPNTGRVIDWLEYVRRGGFKRPQIPQQLMNNGFETGGFTSFSSSLPRPSISELLSASSTAELRAKEFTAQISVSEINNVQNRVAVTEQLSTA